MLAAEVKQYFSHLAQKRTIGHAEHLVGRMSRICEGAEDVEHSANADLAARWADMFHSWMISRGEHETEADLLHTVRHLLGAEIDARSQGFQYISAATAAGGRTVAMLCHVCTGGGCNYASSCREIKCTRAISSRAAPVQGVR